MSCLENRSIWWQFGCWWSCGFGIYYVPHFWRNSCEQGPARDVAKYGTVFFEFHWSIIPSSCWKDRHIDDSHGVLPRIRSRKVLLRCGLMHWPGGPAGPGGRWDDSLGTWISRHALLCHAMPCYAMLCLWTQQFSNIWCQICQSMTFRLKDFLRILRIFLRILRIWRWNTTWIHKLTSYLAALPSHFSSGVIYPTGLTSRSPCCSFQAVPKNNRGHLADTNQQIGMTCHGQKLDSHILCGYLSPYSKMVIISS